jgi:hypothetical protein
LANKELLNPALGDRVNFYEELFNALEEQHIRYLVVGGVAVVLHGFVRATADLDLMVALDPENLKAFIALMKDKGYKPKVPVPIEDFLQLKKRQSWKKEKGMLVFSLFHPKKTEELIDVFVDEPIPFAEAYGRRVSIPLGKQQISVASKDDLIKLKQQAGRAQDLQDIQALEDLGRT